MMPIVEQSPAHHHHHGHGHQTLYHQQHILEQNGKMQLTLILPNGVPSVINVDANTPMMDLLVQAASLNKLNPSGYSLVVLDSNQHVIHFKANQTVGQIVRNCHLPQTNGSSTISLLPKETTQAHPTSKPKSQPFEITVRLLVNLPDAQKILIRVDPTLPLYEIKEQICKQKKYSNSNQYTLRLPTKLDQPLLLGLSLAEYKTNELTLVYTRDAQADHPINPNQHQSFDRLYRTRSEIQSLRETIHEVPNEQQESPVKQDQPTNPIRPSHTSLHAYWNDPNFDTQSQVSNSSSTTKKRRAPRPPGYMSPQRNEPQIVYIHQQQPPMHVRSPAQPLRIEHHQSQESLQADSSKKKRKAPLIAVTNTVEKQNDVDQVQQNVTNETARPGSEPPPPPSPKPQVSPSSIDNFNEALHRTPQPKPSPIEESPESDLTNKSVDDQQLMNSSQTQTLTVEVATASPQRTNLETQSPLSVHSLEPIQTETPYSTPIIVDQREEKKSEQKSTPTNTQAVVETVQTEAIKTPTVGSPIPKPPRQTPQKDKKSSTVDGLLRIINDHTERAQLHQATTKQEKETNENVSYFRVAKSRYGKFETDNRGFVNNSIAIFDSTNQQKSAQPTTHKSLPIESATGSTAQHKPVLTVAAPPTKGKQAYNMLRKYEKEEQLQSMPSNTTDHPKTAAERAQSPTPIQLEVTERTTHITVTVESDRKQLITRASPVTAPQPTPPAVAPKPHGKTITEYRTIRRIGDAGGETTTTTTTTTTAADGTTTSKETANKRLASVSSEDRSRNHSSTSHEELMESIRRFGGSQNLNKN